MDYFGVGDTTCSGTGLPTCDNLRCQIHLQLEATQDLESPRISGTLATQNIHCTTADAFVYNPVFHALAYSVGATWDPDSQVTMQLQFGANVTALYGRGDSTRVTGTGQMPVENLRSGVYVINGPFTLYRP